MNVKLNKCVHGKTCEFSKTCEHSPEHIHGELCDFDCYVSGVPYVCKPVENTSSESHPDDKE